jgi:hypothetical protein
MLLFIEKQHSVKKKKQVETVLAIVLQGDLPRLHATALYGTIIYSVILFSTSIHMNVLEYMSDIKIKLAIL